MKATEGIRFLELLLANPSSGMTAEDLEEAIRLAGGYSPSASFSRASQHWVLKRGRGGFFYLGFAKGTRWLAMIRRDEGIDAFNAAADQLRNVEK